MVENSKEYQKFSLEFSNKLDQFAIAFQALAIAAQKSVLGNAATYFNNVKASPSQISSLKKPPSSILTSGLLAQMSQPVLGTCPALTSRDYLSNNSDLPKTFITFCTAGVSTIFGAPIETHRTIANMRDSLGIDIGSKHLPRAVSRVYPLVYGKNAIGWYAASFKFNAGDEASLSDKMVYEIMPGVAIAGAAAVIVNPIQNLMDALIKNSPKHTNWQKAWQSAILDVVKENDISTKGWSDTLKIAAEKIQNNPKIVTQGMPLRALSMAATVLFSSPEATKSLKGFFQETFGELNKKPSSIIEPNVAESSKVSGVVKGGKGSD